MSAFVIFTSLSFKFVGPYSYTLMIPHTLLQASRYPLGIYPPMGPFRAFVFSPLWDLQLPACQLGFWEDSRS